MSNFIKEIYCLNTTQYNKLMEEMEEGELMEQYRHFQVAENMHQITSWWMTYYIDKFGDFSKGKLKHHRIAMSIFESMRPKEKTETLQYITDHLDGKHKEGYIEPEYEIY